MGDKVEIKITKEGSYGLVEQFRKMGKRVALPDLSLEKIEQNGKPGYQFPLKNPWYTSIPVSTMMEISVTVNGYQVDGSSILLLIREQAIPFAYAKNLYELIWGMGECFQIRIMDGRLSNILKDTNQVEIRFLLRTAFEGYHLPDNRIQYTFDVEMGVR